MGGASRAAFRISDHEEDPMKISRVVLKLILICFALSIADTASAEWPERTVKIVVTFPPGSANDAAARLFADALSKKWSRSVIVENRAGAEGTIGVGAFVAGQDDHTLLYTVGGSISVAPMLVDNVSYDPDRDLLPIAATTAIVLTLTVNNAVDADSIPRLIEALKANPDKLLWTSGPGLLRYAFAAFLKRQGVTMTYVAYRDAAQPQADLGEGRIQVLVTSIAASMAPVQTGKARFLAVLNESRAVALPDVKTVRELGYDQLEVDGLAGFFGGRTMSAQLRDRIAADVAEVCGDGEVRRRLEAGGHNVLGCTTSELKAGIARQRSWFAEISQIVPIREPK
jgi:tripartite-type tricarboxylate transporter receptor subunit TctC